MSRERWMGLSFTLGSSCFLVGPFPGYARLVGGDGAAITFFVARSSSPWAAGSRPPWRSARATDRARAAPRGGARRFGISAIAGHVVPSSGSALNLAAANWNASLGAACFLACALGTLRGHRPTTARGRLAGPVPSG